MRVEDARAIVEMLNAEAVLYTGEPQFTVDEYALDLKEPGYDLAAQTRVVLAEDGGLAGIAEVYNHAPFVRAFMWVRCHHNHRGRGIGSWLTEWAGGVAQTMVERAPTDARVTCGASAFLANEAAGDLLSDHGFAHVRNFHIMRIRLDEPPAEATPPEGFTIDTMVPDVDDRALYAAFDEAFSDHWGHVSRPGEDGFAHWQHRVRNDPHFDAGLKFIARVGEEIAGFSLCSAPAPGESDIGWVNQLGVRRPWRGRGLAKALLRYSFAEFYRRGVHNVGLGVDADSLTGATRLYENAGMNVHHTNAVFEMELRAGIVYATQSLDG